MTEINQKIISMIRQGKFIEEIAKETNLPYKLIYQRITNLINNGYMINRQYYCNEPLKYTFSDNNSFCENNTIKLENKKKLKNIEIMVISDLHIGNVKQREDALDTIYNYCSKNNINIIINCGDLLDGVLGKEKLVKASEQVEYILKNYPFDKNIYNYIVLGNHDKSIEKSCNINLETALYNMRHDIVPLGRDFGNIKIENDTIHITHENKNYIQSGRKPKIHLIGHSHISRLEVTDSTPKLFIGTLSNINTSNEINMPRACTLKISFDDKKIKSIEVTNLLIVNEKILITGTNFISYQNTNNNTGAKQDFDLQYETYDPNYNLGELSKEQKDYAKSILNPLGSKKKKKKK